jgi:hypothetical protein
VNQSEEVVFLGFARSAVPVVCQIREASAQANIKIQCPFSSVCLRVSDLESRNSQRFALSSYGSSCLPAFLLDRASLRLAPCLVGSFATCRATNLMDAEFMQ